MVPEGDLRTIHNWVSHALRERDVVIITLAAVVLLVGVFLPWYTVSARACDEYRSVSIAQISSGGWRVDLLLCGLATWASSLFQTRFRVVTIIGAWLTLALALVWWFNTPPGGVGVRGQCAPSFHGVVSLQGSYGAGVGVFISLGASLAMIYGAHLRSRRLRLRGAS
jgi:hypothetical protein